MNTQSPYEQIRFIHDVIKDRKDKNQNTFFSVKLVRADKVTPLVDKETGDTFYETIIQYLTRYDVSAIIIELYHGKAHNIKEPIDKYTIQLKRSSDLGISFPISEDVQLTQAESVVSTEKHYAGLFEKERGLLMLEFELKRLQLEHEELRKKYKKKKQYIEELESELEGKEKQKKNSLGNVSLGLVASNALEGFAKSSFGIGILKNVFGAKEEVLNGLLGLDETNSINEEPEQNSTASIITKSKEETKPQTEQEKVRQYVIKQITDFMTGIDDGSLRLYYEIIQLIGKDQTKLQQVYSALKISTKENSINTPSKNKEASKKIEGEENDKPDINDSS
jgi:hypothetical protein